MSLILAVGVLFSCPSCSRQTNTEEVSGIIVTDEPRDYRVVEKDSITMLDSIKRRIEQMKPDVIWLKPQLQDGSSMCDVDDRHTPGTKFRSALRQTTHFPSPAEWTAWIAAVKSVAAAYGYTTSPEELPAQEGDHRSLITSAEGDQLIVASINTGGFSFWVNTACAPYPEGEAPAAPAWPG